MIDDWTTKARRLAVLLTQARPIAYERGGYECTLCEVTSTSAAALLDDAGGHDELCPWRLAHEYLAALPAARDNAPD